MRATVEQPASIRAATDWLSERGISSVAYVPNVGAPTIWCGTCHTPAPLALHAMQSATAIFSDVTIRRYDDIPGDIPADARSVVAEMLQGNTEDEARLLALELIP